MDPERAVPIEPDWPDRRIAKLVSGSQEEAVPMKPITFLSRIPSAFVLFSLVLAGAVLPNPSPALGLEVDGWQSGFQAIGPDREVYAIAEYDGGLFIGGSFRCAGDLPAEHIAVWNRSSWGTLGEGVDGPVNAMCVWNGKLVVAGSFWHAGGVSANCIATWDGSSWGTLGTGFNGSVFAVTIAGDRLVVGGVFSEAGGHAARNIAIWDGVAWTNMGEGMNAPIRALAFYSGRLVAAGEFHSAGGVEANHIAAFDGLTWAPLGEGVDGIVYALHGPFMGKLIVGGSFDTAGGSPAANLAVWNGSTWSALGANGPVYALGVDPTGFLVCGGSFTHLWNTNAKNIARIGIVAAPLPGGGTDGAVFAVAAYGDQLVVSGTFRRVGDAGILAPNLAANDPGLSTWSRLACPTGNGIMGEVTAMVPFGGGLVVGGYNTVFGDLDGESAAMWSAAGWSSIGLGDEFPDLYPGSLGVYDNQLVLGCGDYTAPVRLWTGTSWLKLGDGALTGEAYVLRQHGGSLIVGGNLEGAGPTEFINIASWDGDSWDPLGGGVDGGSVSALATYGGDLYAGGSFTTAGGDPIRAIARWDGSNWSQLGGGLGSGYLSCMAAFNGELIIGGSFTLAKGGGYKHLARWDGSTWTTIETEATSINDLVVCDAGLAVLYTEGGRSLVSLWDGSSWTPLASDIDDEVRHIAFYDDALWICGRFSKVGGMPSANIAAWRGPATPVQISIHAEAADGGARISWEVPSDLDPVAFRVERSEDGWTDWTDLTPQGLDRSARNYLDTEVEAGRTYEYRIRVIGGAGDVQFVGPTIITIAMPKALSLSVVPNPATGPVEINLQVPGNDRAVVAIYDVQGREVARPWDGTLPPGIHRIPWDGRDRAGNPLPAGRYYARLMGSTGGGSVPIVRVR
jgi:hypothetical protein